MSYTATFQAVADSIAALTIPGVTVQTSGAVTISNYRNTGALAPRQEQFVTDLSISVDSVDKQRLTLTYTLNYQYYHAPVGSERNDYKHFPGLLANVAAILSALLSNNTVAGALDIFPTVAAPDIVYDPAGSPFYGCSLAVKVMQFLDA
jgi:hypothetical protein